MDFFKNYGVMVMAIVVIIGEKLNELVSSIANDLVMQIFLHPALNAAYVDNIKELSYNGILYGKILGAGLNFLIIAFVVFIFAKFTLKEEKVAKK